jgi:oxalate decarboxylase/phosphoglucose isomerase-like protein (cupin superfamily)
MKHFLETSWPGRNKVIKFMKKKQTTKLSYFVTLPHISDEGSLCFAEEENHLPIKLKRFYYIFDVDKGAKRGFHAHKKTKQVLFCIRGSIKIILDNGKKREEIVLTKPNEGIFLDTMMWHEMVDFTKDTMLLVAASEVYEESDYIRDYDTFLHLAAMPKVIQNSRFPARFTQLFSSLSFKLNSLLF